MNFASLNPLQVLQALDAVGVYGDGRILQLNSYENRVFQLMLEDGGAVVAKFYRPARWSDEQILEEHAFATELAAAEVPVVAPLVLSTLPGEARVRLCGQPPTLAVWTAPNDTADSDDSAHGHAAPHRFAVAPRCAGREPALDDPEVLRQLGRFIGRLHAVGRRQPFAHRHRLDARTDGQAALHSVLEGGFVTPAERPGWEQAARQALEATVAAFDDLQPLATLRLHGDCHLGNVLWRQADGAHPGGPHLVDLDDAMQGPAVQDLWMLVSGDRATMAQQLRTLLEGYELFSDFDDRECRLIEPLRTLRMLRHSAWLAARWDDPTFPMNFPWFGTAAYWSQQTTQLREQLALMAAP